MLKFTIKRVIATIPTILITLLIAFFIIRIIPGDAAWVVLGEEATVEEVEAWREANGLNSPWFVQYANWVADVARGDMGVSLVNGQSVMARIMRCMEPTILLVLLSTLIAVVLGIPIGLICALKRNSVFDTLVMTVSMVALAAPGFWLGLMLCLWFAVKLRLFPVSGYEYIATGGILKAVHCLLLPALSMGIRRMANIARFTRSCMLDVIGSDYVRTARAKGVKEIVIVFKHMLRSTMAPLITTIGQGIAHGFAGALTIERIFQLPGIGMLAASSITNRDTPQIQAIIVYVALIYIGINLILDILYKFCDPRIELD